MTLIVSAVTKYDGKGLAKAKKDIKGFDKSVKTLAKSLLGLYSATKLTQFANASVKAFLADDKAAKSLSRTLDNLGLGFKSVGVENYINALQKQSGVLDDFLRPAYQGLVTVLGSTSKAQDALNIALDVAAGTGQDVVSVSKTLSKAYAGNATALAKMVPGLSKTILASKNLEQINAELTRLFGGQAATAAAGYTGQMNMLTVAAADASETIGKSLVDALILASGSTGMEGLGKKIDKAAGKISKFIDEIGIFIAYTKMAFSGASIRDLEAYAGVLRGMNAPSINIPLKPAQARAQLAAEKKALDLAKKNNILTKKSAIDALALKKAARKLELEQIQIQAALKYGIDEETRLRLLLQKALLEKDADEATRLYGLLKENEGKTKELANLLANLPKADDPFADWPGIIANINRLMKDLKIPGGATAALATQGLTVNAAGTGVVDTGSIAAAAAAKSAADAKKIAEDIAKIWAEANAKADADRVKLAAATDAQAAQAETDAATAAAFEAEKAALEAQAALQAFEAAQAAIDAAAQAIFDASFFGAPNMATGGERGYAQGGGDNFYVTVNAGVVGSEQVIANEVQKVLQNLNRFGSSTNYAGSIDQ